MLSDKELFEICRCPGKRVDIVLDTDTYNEIDDQFAIAYTLKHRERFRIRGFTCAPVPQDNARGDHRRRHCLELRRNAHRSAFERRREAFRYGLCRLYAVPCR